MDNRKIIYLDDAIDAIKAMPDCPNGFSDTYDKAWIISVLEEVPGKATGWTPVSEGLPDEFEVICCDDKGEMLIANPFECSDSDTGYSAESAECYMYNVVAWMPKPKPYKEEE